MSWWLTLSNSTHSGRVVALASYQSNPAFKPAEAGTRSEVYPRWSEYLRSYQGPVHRLPSRGGFSTGALAWTVARGAQRRVVVVVVGVTPHQGARESRAQGQGPQVSSFKSRNERRC